MSITVPELQGASQALNWRNVCGTPDGVRLGNPTRDTGCRHVRAGDLALSRLFRESAPLPDFRVEMALRRVILAR